MHGWKFTFFAECFGCCRFKRSLAEDQRCAWSSRGLNFRITNSSDLKLTIRSTKYMESFRAVPSKYLEIWINYSKLLLLLQSFKGCDVLEKTSLQQPV